MKKKEKINSFIGFDLVIAKLKIIAKKFLI